MRMIRGDLAAGERHSAEISYLCGLNKTKWTNLSLIPGARAPSTALDFQYG